MIFPFLLFKNQMKDKKVEKTGDIGNNLQFLYLISLQWERIQELMARAIIEQNEYSLGLQLAICKLIVTIMLTCVCHPGTLNSLEENVT